MQIFKVFRDFVNIQSKPAKDPSSAANLSETQFKKPNFAGSGSDSYTPPSFKAKMQRVIGNGNWCC